MNSTFNRANQYIEFSLWECGKEKCIPSKVFSYTPKNYHLFHLVLSGQGSFSLNGKKYNLNAGNIFYIPPGETAEYHPDAYNPWTYIWLGFNGSNSGKYLESCDISSDKPVVYLNGNTSCQASLEKLYAHYLDVGFLDMMCLAHGYEFFSCLVSIRNKSLTATLSPNEKIINAAKEFIINNYQFPITVMDIANSLGITPNYLANVFSANLKIPPKAYLIGFRMDKAKILLQSRSYNIKNVAEMVGYPNQLHFSNEFKRICHMSPLAYRQSTEQEGEAS